LAHEDRLNFLVVTVKTSAKTVGLRYWMLRVLAECDKVAPDFKADPVHDLRVALRRCRSMADGLMAMDPDPAWKAMKKAGKQLFQRLGELRDVQIMMEWTRKLESAAAHPSTSNPLAPREGGSHLGAAPSQADSQPHESLQFQAEGGPLAWTEAEPGNRDPSARALLGVLVAREHEHREAALKVLEEFDRKQWRHWSSYLPSRTARFRPGSTLFKHLALERWTDARRLHTRALSSRSPGALHQLRIGIKRFRYIVENFLPEQHRAWSDDLKHVQDLLGEVRDLEVLWEAAVSSHVFGDEISRNRWHALLRQEMEKRIEAYREKTAGAHSLWQIWRASLPKQQQLKAIATRRMKLWAKALDPDFAHSERVARLAVELFDGLNAAHLSGSAADADARSSLQMAAWLHDVGKAKTKKGHHKVSFKLISAYGTPLGWKRAGMQRAAITARFHCGALPVKNRKILRDSIPAEQTTAIELAGILRLANAFDAAHDGSIRRVRVEKLAAPPPNGNRRSGRLKRKPRPVAANQAVVIAAEGYRFTSTNARAIAAERHLLETILHRPIIVKPMKSSNARLARRQASVA
jgi:CHAD domain-containing protein